MSVTVNQGKVVFGAMLMEPIEADALARELEQAARDARAYVPQLKVGAFYYGTCSDLSPAVNSIFFVEHPSVVWRLSPEGATYASGRYWREVEKVKFLPLMRGSGSRLLRVPTEHQAGVQE